MATCTSTAARRNGDRMPTLRTHTQSVFIHDPRKGFLSFAIRRVRSFFTSLEASLKAAMYPEYSTSLYTIDWNNTSDTKRQQWHEKGRSSIDFLKKSSGMEGRGPPGRVTQPEKSFAHQSDIKLDFNPSADFHCQGFERTPNIFSGLWMPGTLMTYRYRGSWEYRLRPLYQPKLNVGVRAELRMDRRPTAPGKECCTDETDKFTHSNRANNISE